MATWITPKTNWSPEDYFNFEDYNRIVNNLIVIYNLAIKHYVVRELAIMEETKSYQSILYADEMNAIENNLAQLNADTYKFDIGTTQKYIDNGITPNYAEFNRIESTQFKLYSHLKGELPHRLAFRLGDVPRSTKPKN